MTIVLLSQSKGLPSLDEIRADLVAAGFASAKVISTSNDPGASPAAEVSYESDRMPVVMRFGENFVDTDIQDFELAAVIEKSNAKKTVLSSPIVNGEFAAIEGQTRKHFFRHALLAELAPAGENTQKVCRFIYINASENVDSKTLQSVVEVIRTQTDAL